MYKIKEIVMEFEACVEIDVATAKAVDMSRSFSGCPVRFSFNGVDIVYDGKSEATRLAEFYYRESNKRARKGTK